MLTYTIWTEQTVEEVHSTSSNSGSHRARWYVGDCHESVSEGAGGYTREVTVLTNNVTIWHETATNSGSNFYAEVCSGGAQLTEWGFGGVGFTSYHGTWYPDGLTEAQGTHDDFGTISYVGASTYLSTCDWWMGTYECELTDYFNTNEPYANTADLGAYLVTFVVTTPSTTHTGSTTQLSGFTTSETTVDTTIGRFSDGYLGFQGTTTQGTVYTYTTYSVSTHVTTTTTYSLSVYDFASNSTNPDFGPKTSDTSYNVWGKTDATVVVLDHSERLYEVTVNLTGTVTFGDTRYFLEHVGPTVVTIVPRWSPPEAGLVFHDDSFASSGEDTTTGSSSLRTTTTASTTISHAQLWPYYGFPLPMTTQSTLLRTTQSATVVILENTTTFYYAAPHTIDTTTLGTTSYSVKWSDTTIDSLGSTILTTNITTRALNNGSYSNPNVSGGDGDYYSFEGENAGGHTQEWSTISHIGAIPARTEYILYTPWSANRAYALENAFSFGYGLADGTSFQIGTRINVNTPFTFNPGWVTCSLDYVLTPHPYTSFETRTGPGAQVDTLFCRGTEVVWQSSTTTSTAISVGSPANSSTYSTSTTSNVRQTFPYSIDGTATTYVDMESVIWAYKNVRGRMRREVLTEWIEAGIYRLTTGTLTFNGFAGGAMGLATSSETSYRTQTVASTASRAAREGIPIYMPAQWTWQGKYYTASRNWRALIGDDNTNNFRLNVPA